MKGMIYRFKNDRFGLWSIHISKDILQAFCLLFAICKDIQSIALQHKVFEGLYQQVKILME